MPFSSTRDGNRQVAWYGLSSTDGVTPTRIKINSITTKAIMEIGVSVSAVIANLKTNAIKDDNFIAVTGGVSNADATVFIPISVNPATGAILVST